MLEEPKHNHLDFERVTGIAMVVGVFACGAFAFACPASSGSSD